MAATVIRVENLSKQYRLGEISTGALSHDIKRWWYQLRGKQDPFAKIGEVNDRTAKASSDYVWALQGINFDVKQGEVLGIIGKNGAGKSTLLKILSKTTTPTTGSVKIKGRIASLLEVGTGFHPELSGRENIFLNGAILGMTKKEIKTKFDEIVDFSGVERYIDTPVKRYSSGMYVRLAFAVAAHLEQEILIVDEVLAVGDAEFQKKCLGKMKDVSVSEGRTVLFVSHSMTSIQALCNNALYLENGRCQSGVERIDIAISRYLYGYNNSTENVEYDGSNAQVPAGQVNRQVKLLKLQLINEKDEVVNRFKVSENIKIKFIWENKDGVDCTPNFQLKLARDASVVAMVGSDSSSDWSGNLKSAKGIYETIIVIPKNLLNANDYFISVALDSHSPKICYEYHVDVLKISIWDPMDEHSLGRGMFTSVREDVIFWPALASESKKLD